MKYMVMECHLGYVVVMDEDGRFLKAANRQYEVGQLLTEIIPIQPPRHKTARWVSSLVAAAACLVLLLTTILPIGGAPYASVYVKINPEIRIDMDKNDRVIGLQGINADGIALIDGYDYHRKDLNLVTDELVDLAIEAGYLHAGGQITLTLDSTDQIWVTDHSQALSEHVYQHLQDRFNITVEISLHAGEQRDDLATVPPQTDAPTVPSTVEPSSPVYYYDDDDDDREDDDDWDDDDNDDDDRHDDDRHDDDDDHHDDDRDDDDDHHDDDRDDDDD